MSPTVADLPANMQAKITVTDAGCWYWTGAVNSKGYGQVGVNGKSRSVHRVTYEMFVGLIPDGLTIDHRCRVKRCCNPDPEHLEVVTRRENVQRAAVLITHCPQGHPLSGDNLVIKPRRDGSKIRNCRICKNRCQREAYARRRALAKSA